MKIEGKPLITIIIAFYNEANYLDKCLMSVVNQTYNSFEVLLINDGSTDDSLEIAKKYSKKFFKTNLISIKNSGHAEARNIGLENCTGDYVTFLDADDTLKPNMVEAFIDNINNFKADITICDISVFSEDGKINYDSNWNKKVAEIDNTNELIDEMYSGGISENIWAKVFKTSIAKKINFERGLWFDDRPFLIEFLYLSKTASFINKQLLKVYRRNSSITRRVLESKRIVDVYRVFELELNISTKFNSLLNNKNKIGKFTLNRFIDTYIMQIIDKNQITEIDQVRSVFLEHIKRFKKEVKKQKIELKLKHKIILKLLLSPIFFGWNCTNLMFYLLKNRRIRKVRMLKNQ